MKNVLTVAVFLIIILLLVGVGYSMFQRGILTLPGSLSPTPLVEVTPEETEEIVGPSVSPSPFPTSGATITPNLTIPQGVTENFYFWYTRCILAPVPTAAPGGTEQCPFSVDGTISNELFSNLVKRLGRNIDPIICAQTLPQKITVGSSAATDTNAASVIVTETFTNGDIQIPVELRRIDNRWKIVEIACPNL